MRPPRRRWAALILCALAVAPACANRKASKGAAHVDRSVITREQMLEYRFTTAYDAVEALHPNWLRARGPDSFRAPTQVQVYLDDSRVGGIETLRAIGTTNVLFIRFYDGVTAAARWGLDHGQGVIYVSTRS